MSGSPRDDVSVSFICFGLAEGLDRLALAALRLRWRFRAVRIGKKREMVLCFFNKVVACLGGGERSGLNGGGLRGCRRLFVFDGV